MAILGDTKAISLTLLDGVIGNLNPKTTDVYTLGTSSLKWNNIYSTTFTGALSGNASTATTATKLGSSNVGAADRPIYLSAGTATQTTYKMAATNVTATTALAITTNLDTGVWYVSGTNSTDLYSQSDGAAYVNKYNDSWLHEIYGDYRTGQIAVRGKNNGTWQAWRKVLDSSNYTTWAVAKTSGVTAVTWDTTNKKLTRTINGTAADVLQFAAGSNVSLTAESGKLTIAASISNNITGSGTSGYLAKFNGANTITNGPQLGSATTTYLRNDGSWATPPGTYSLPLAASGTRGGIQIGYSESGTNYAVKLSSEKAYVTVPWTDTKVTSVDNHYAPSANTDSALSASATGASAAWSIDVVKGVTISRDAKGHVTGVSVTSGKIPANPNTDTKQRTYRSSTNVNLPIAGINTGNATAAYSAISSGSYKDVYAAIPENTANVATINPSTGRITATGLTVAGAYVTSGIDIGDWTIDTSEGIGNYDWGDYFIWLDSGKLKSVFDVISTSNIGTSSPTSSTPKAGAGSLYFQYATTVSDNPLGAVDWIVEEGIASDIWIYRKWNSGYIEAWRNGPLDYGSLATTSQWSYGFYYPSVITMGMPKINDVALFQTVKYGQCSTVSSTGLLYCAIKTLAADKIEFYLANSKSETVTVGVTAYVFGTWK